jgi:uncharacterized protein (DUF952 family)
MIYHITTQTDWEQALELGFYTPQAFAAEGFIHACKAEQVEGVCERYYKDQTGLVVLHINERFLKPPHTFVFVEASNDEFPHIFGPINLDAVVEVTLLAD